MLALWSSLIVGGFLSGILAGLLGIGGGTILVPLLVALGFAPLQSVATSSLAILITSISGTVQNWRMGYFDLRRIMLLGIPAIATAQLGVFLANKLPSAILLAAFAVLLLVNIFLVDLKNRLKSQQSIATEQAEIRQAEIRQAEIRQAEIRQAEIRQPQTRQAETQNQQRLISRLITGSLAGVLAGLFGVGGGVIMVPLQMLLLGEPIKVAIQTSLAVVVLTAISASIGHTISGNVIGAVGVVLGLGGLVGAQVSTRVLPKLSDRLVSIIFRAFLAVLSLYIFWQAWQEWQA